MPTEPARGQCQANEKAELTAADAATRDMFGTSVAISGDIAVVGAFNQENPGNNLGFGKAYVFEFDGANWTQVAELTPSDPEPDKEFGIRVAIDGDTIVVGAAQDGGGIGVGAGAAYVYVRPVVGWVGPLTEDAKLTASDPAAGDVFGGAVAISGDVIVIGALSNDDAGGSTGSAYVFEKPLDGWVTMTETQKLLASYPTAGDRFGRGADIDGETIVIGADQVNTGPGSAHVFERQVGVWVETAKLTPSDGTDGDRFGFAPVIRGNTICIGAFKDDDAAANTGSVYVFEEPLGGWGSVPSPINETAKLAASDAVTGDNFGISVALSKDENTVVVGAYAGENSNRAGSAYGFRKPLGGWDSVPVPINEDVKLIPSDTEAGDRVGRSIAISGAVVVVGSSKHDHDGVTWSGGAWVFHGLSDCNANDTLDICDIVDGTSADENEDGIPDECEGPQDSDGDGAPDGVDNCPNSDLGESIVIDECDTGVGNELFDDGCTMADRIAECAEGVTTHGEFVSCVAQLTNDWKQDGLICGREKGRIQSCAAQGNLGSQCQTDANCDDGLFCNGVEVCLDGACVVGDPCPGQSCDEATDECID
jgi:hypothetical protein